MRGFSDVSPMIVVLVTIPSSVVVSYIVPAICAVSVSGVRIVVSIIVSVLVVSTFIASPECIPVLVPSVTGSSIPNDFVVRAVISAHRVGVAPMLSIVVVVSAFNCR